MSKQYAFNITGTGKISAVVGNKSFTVETDHPNYHNIVQAVKDRQFDVFEKLVDVSATLKKFVKGGVSIESGQVTYNGTVIHNTLTTRILKFMNEGLPFEPLLKFLENLLQNPSFRAVNELYDFLEAGDMPITEDGCFLAFKNVRADWKDIHSGTMDNSIGQVLTMPRNMVDEDKNRTCSAGLHFCSIKYLTHFSDSNGGHTVIVKINPADVVSIPADYNNTKGRTCKYEVVAEYTDNWRERVKTECDNGFNSGLYASNGEEYYDEEDDEQEEDLTYGVKPSGHLFYNKRNDKGQFVSN